jgi:hypothetical protein
VASSPSARLLEQIKETEATIHKMLMEFLPYGYFNLTITGKTNKQGRVDVFVEGGPSIKHCIETDRLNRPRDSWSGSANHDDKD